MPAHSLSRAGNGNCRQINRFLNKTNKKLEKQNKKTEETYHLGYIFFHV